jgi:hypothetical protein
MESYNLSILKVHNIDTKIKFFIDLAPISNNLQAYCILRRIVIYYRSTHNAKAFDLPTQLHNKHALRRIQNRRMSFSRSAFEMEIKRCGWYALNALRVQDHQSRR